MWGFANGELADLPRITLTNINRGPVTSLKLRAGLTLNGTPPLSDCPNRVVDGIQGRTLASKGGNRQALEHLGIYHSHPQGENSPSSIDLERAFYPEVAYLIISPYPAASPPIRAFTISEGQARELQILRI